MSSADSPINWKRNLTVTWLGCFLTGAAFSLVMPFLPLYVEQLGVTGHSALNMWSGLVFSITFLFSAVASPFWGGLADRKGRKNYAAALRAGDGYRHDVDGAGAKHLAVSGTAGLAGAVGWFYSQCECPDRHPDPAPEERLGAGYAIYRRRERARCLARWRAAFLPTIGDCAPSSF